MSLIAYFPNSGVFNGRFFKRNARCCSYFKRQLTVRAVYTDTEAGALNLFSRKRETEIPRTVTQIILLKNNKRFRRGIILNGTLDACRHRLHRPFLEHVAIRFGLSKGNLTRNMAAHLHLNWHVPLI